MKKIIFTGLLLVTVIGLSHAAKLPSEGFFEAPYQTGGGNEYSDDDYYDDNFYSFNSGSIGGSSDFSTYSAECDDANFYWATIVAECRTCAESTFSDETNFNNICTTTLIDAYNSCVSLNQDACDATAAPIGKATPLLAFALSYMGVMVLLKVRKRKLEN